MMMDDSGPTQERRKLVKTYKKGALMSMRKYAGRSTTIYDNKIKKKNCHTREKKNSTPKMKWINLEEIAIET